MYLHEDELLVSAMTEKAKTAAAALVRRNREGIFLYEERGDTDFALRLELDHGGIPRAVICLGRSHRLIVRSDMAGWRKKNV